MNEIYLHTSLCWALLGLAVLTAGLLSARPAPYGRHDRGGWGPRIPYKLGWFLMEMPATIAFLIFFTFGSSPKSPISLVFLFLWQTHYLHRTLIFSFRMRPSKKNVPLLIVFLGFLFNIFNSYLNARWVSHLGQYSSEWLVNPFFIIGIAIFIVGLVLNIHSDSVLFKLRKSTNRGYSIPYGGAYRWVSSPNYLGDLLEWFGWALATFSLAGLCFFIYSAANLVPRAVSNHKWYRRNFDNYPVARKRLIPYCF